MLLIHNIISVSQLVEKLARKLVFAFVYYYNFNKVSFSMFKNINTFHLIVISFFKRLINASGLIKVTDG